MLRFSPNFGLKMRGSNSVDGDSDVRLMFYPPLPMTPVGGVSDADFGSSLAPEIARPGRAKLPLSREVRTDAAVPARREPRPPSRGFTLVELLVVVAIIGALVALLLPAVQAARESSRRSRCANNLRQQGLALIGFEGEHRTLPVGCVDCLEDPKRFHSWNSQLLPWLEQAALRKQLDFRVPSHQAPNLAAAVVTLDVFLCPSTLEQESASPSSLWKKAAFTDYGGVYGVGGDGQDPDEEEWNKQHLKSDALGAFLYDEAVAFSDITDGTSNTVACAELLLRRRLECEWINGNNIFAQEVQTPINAVAAISIGIGSPHPGGAQVVFCDGHVSFLAEHMDQATLNALLTRSGEELP
jgi:prepilin-type N-terminal cleavage/methylation domain-containing protein/prepilin-type processing-associated H-X9-DG protein